MRRFGCVIIIILLIGCNNSNDFRLPKTKFYEELPPMGLNRNIILNVKEKKLYCGDILVPELYMLQESTIGCVELNEGSNKITIGLAFDKNQDYEVIDSFLYELGKRNFCPIYIMTNDLNDSVGIKINTSWTFEFLPQLDFDTIFKNPDIISRLTFDTEFVNCDSNIYLRSDLNSICDDIITNGKTLWVLPTKENRFSDIVQLLDSYNSSLYCRREILSIDTFKVSFNSLNWEQKHIIKREHPNRLIIDYIDR